jgi:S1-C subfamily serine protease
VFAIGNPFGLDQTLTTGVISALGRRISATEQAGDFQTSRTIDGVVQTDAAINPGNSGGPLLDSHGRLIGVNTAIFSPSGAYAGVGFAIPVDIVNRTVPELIRHGRIVRPDVGIVPFHDQLTRQFELDGVLVRDVYVDSPAAKAGIEPTKAEQFTKGFRVLYRIRLGDLIVAANGQPIKDLDAWFTFLEQHQVGDRVTLRVVRGLRTSRERQLDVEVVLAPPHDDEQ